MRQTAAASLPGVLPCHRGSRRGARSHGRARVTSTSAAGWRCALRHSRTRLGVSSTRRSYATHGASRAASAHSGAILKSVFASTGYGARAAATRHGAPGRGYNARQSSQYAGSGCATLAKLLRGMGEPGGRRNACTSRRGAKPPGYCQHGSPMDFESISLHPVFTLRNSTLRN